MLEAGNRTRNSADGCSSGRRNASQVFSAWLAALAAAVTIMIGGIKARTYLRRELRTLTVSPHMKDPS